MAPIMPMVMNHTAMIGPKKRPTTPVPRACTTKSPMRMPTPMSRMKGSMRAESAGTARKPSTAERTEIAGVISASP